jgi:hypothetical protein
MSEKECGVNDDRDPKNSGLPLSAKPHLNREASGMRRAVGTPAPRPMRSPMPCGAGIAIATETTKFTSNSWTMRCRVATRG